MPDQVLMITGASRGIGAATARRAADHGFQVALLARSTDTLTGLVHELGEHIAMALPCDVTDYDSLTRAVSQVEEHYGRLDAVLANAGINHPSSFLGPDEPEGWRDMVLTNVYGAAITARAAMPALIRSKGHLVFTGSNAGRGIRPGNLYSATKWAVTGLAQNIRAEAVGTGVRVTLVQPGMVQTDMTANRTDVPKLHPDDIANGILYALTQPPTVDVNELTIRPVGQAPHS